MSIGVKNLTVQWKLREVMARKRMTTVRLAKILGVHENTIYKWRIADVLPAIGGETLERICNALNCSLYELIEYTPSQEDKDSPTQ